MKLTTTDLMLRQYQASLGETHGYPKLELSLTAIAQILNSDMKEKEFDLPYSNRR